MNKISTAEKFLEKKFPEFEDLDNGHIWVNIENTMIEFAKLHVDAALKQAAHQSTCYNKSKFPGDINWVVDIESILESYPLENIK